MAVVKVTEPEIKNAVNSVLQTGIWPIYRTQDDNGLERDEYFQFVRDVIRKLGLIVPD